MDSRIVFLGTAGDVYTYGKQIRASGGIIIKHDDMQLLLNPGPGCLVQAAQLGISLRETDAILVTQNSILCANDLNASINAMTNGGMDQKGVVVAAKSVLEGTPRLHSALSPFQRQSVEKVISIKPDDRLGLNEIDIIPTKTASSDETAVGFQIRTNKFIVSYLSDTVYERRVALCHKEAEILIINIPSISPKQKDQTTSIEGAIKFVKDINPRLVLITNFGTKMNDSDVLQAVRTIQKETGVHTSSAKDGLSVNPTTHSASVRQQKLRL
jgi:ribonuclease BN (tRNA processing enzyme)